MILTIGLAFLAGMGLLGSIALVAIFSLLATIGVMVGIAMMAGIAVLTITATVLLVSWTIGGRLVAAAPCIITSAPSDLVAETISLVSGAGNAISGWYVPGSVGQGVVVLLHGVRASRLDMLARARIFNRQGFAVILCDFAGQGMSSGRSISFGYHERHDVTAILEHCRQRLPHERIGVVAVSMGAAALVMSPRRDCVQAMVLEGMYPTLRDAVRNRIGLFLGRWGRWLAPLLTWQLTLRLGFTLGQMRPIDAVGSLRIPTLFIAGAADKRTTLSESEAVYGRAGGDKSLWIIADAGHVDFLEFASEEYVKRVGGFLRRHLRGS